MLSSWRGRRRWPPPPFVEDELDSLAREAHGISEMYETSDLEGVQYRGTVDQDPIILQLDMSPTPPPASDSDTSLFSGPSGDSTTTNNLELVTNKETVFPFPETPEAEHSTEEQEEDSTGIDLLRGRTSNSRIDPVLAQAVYGTRSRNRSRRGSHSRPPSSYIPVEHTRSFPHRAISVDRGLPSHRSKDIPISQNQLSRRIQSKMPTSLDRNRGRSRSVRYDNAPTERPISRKKYTVTSSSLPSHSAATERRENCGLTGRMGQAGGEKSSVPPPVAPTVAERLERKLQRRQELRELTGLDRKISLSASQSPARGSRSSLSAKTHSSSTSSQSGASSSTKVQPVSGSLGKDKQPVLSSTATSTQKPSKNNALSKSSSSEKAQPGQPRGSRSQSLGPRRKTLTRPAQTSEIKDCLGKSQLRSRSCQRNMPSLGLSKRPYPETENLSLLPCPRSIPMGGHRDWYTIQGMTYLDICPSCTEQLSQSRFHGFFIPSTSKPRGQKVRCSFSQPWIRLAWIQAIRKDHCDLRMLHQVNRPPATLESCPGRTPSEQYWYRIVDPITDMFLPRFSVCSACVRNLRILMPSHWNTFERSPTLRESVCDFDTASPRFVQYIDHFDAAANHAEISGSPFAVRAVDLAGFLAYARRKVVLRDCRRDSLISSTWWYIPELPEFTVCEDCYDDVVWPLSKANYLIASMFSSSQRLPFENSSDRCREASCQLYSPRMRIKFRDAVLKVDFAHLESVALMRHKAERRFRDRRRELLDDERRGYDRDVLLRLNAVEWRRWE